MLRLRATFLDFAFSFGYLSRPAGKPPPLCEDRPAGLFLSGRRSVKVPLSEDVPKPVIRCGTVGTGTVKSYAQNRQQTPKVFLQIILF